MIAFPNCKINLGLRILKKRSDGYHDLETVFYPLPFYDIAEVIRSADGNTSFTSSGLVIETGPEENLCIKAYRLLKNDFPGLPEIRLHLHKTIPAGAGLGGGSADGAFVLQLLNTKFHLGISAGRLMQYALELGSDCPFFILNKPCYATGRGEQLTPLPVDLSGYFFVLVNPGIHISTARAFSSITPAMPGQSVKAIIQQPVETWKDALLNDFEKGVFMDYPQVGAIKEELYTKGAVYASLSGSGSTVYGIFRKDIAPQLTFPAHYFIKQLFR